MLSVLFLTGSFASTLPTYQRSEVILFIMSKVPLPSLHHPVETGRTGLVHCFLPAYPLWPLGYLCTKKDSAPKYACLGF